MLKKIIFATLLSLPLIAQAVGVKSTAWEAGEAGPHSIFNITCADDFYTSCSRHFSTLTYIFWKCTDVKTLYLVNFDGRDETAVMNNEVARPLCDARN